MYVSELLTVTYSDACADISLSLSVLDFGLDLNCFCAEAFTVGEGVSESLNSYIVIFPVFR